MKKAPDFDVLLKEFVDIIKLRNKLDYELARMYYEQKKTKQKLKNLTKEVCNASD